MSPELVKLVPSQTIPDGFSYVSNVPVFAAFEFLAFKLEDALEGKSYVVITHISWNNLRIGQLRNGRDAAPINNATV